MSLDSIDLSYKPSNAMNKDLGKRESLWGRHKIKIITGLVVGAAAVVALAIFAFPPATAALGMAALMTKAAFMALPVATKIGVIIAGGIGGFLVGSGAATAVSALLPKPTVCENGDAFAYTKPFQPRMEERTIRVPNGDSPTTMLKVHEDFKKDACSRTAASTFIGKDSVQSLLGTGPGRAAGVDGAPDYLLEHLHSLLPDGCDKIDLLEKLSKILMQASNLKLKQKIEDHVMPKYQIQIPKYEPTDVVRVTMKETGLCVTIQHDQVITQDLSTDGCQDLDKPIAVKAVLTFELSFKGTLTAAVDIQSKALTPVQAAPQVAREKVAQLLNLTNSQSSNSLEGVLAKALPAGELGTPFQKLIKQLVREVGGYTDGIKVNGEEFKFSELMKLLKIPVTKDSANAIDEFLRLQLLSEQNPERYAAPAGNCPQAILEERKEVTQEQLELLCSFLPTAINSDPVMEKLLTNPDISENLNYNLFISAMDVGGKKVPLKYRRPYSGDFQVTQAPDGGSVRLTGTLSRELPVKENDQLAEGVEAESLIGAVQTIVFVDSAAEKEWQIKQEFGCFMLGS